MPAVDAISGPKHTFMERAAAFSLTLACVLALALSPLIFIAIGNAAIYSSALSSGSPKLADNLAIIHAGDIVQVSGNLELNPTDRPSYGSGLPMALWVMRCRISGSPQHSGKTHGCDVWVPSTAKLGGWKVSSQIFKALDRPGNILIVPEESDSVSCATGLEASNGGCYLEYRLWRADIPYTIVARADPVAMRLLPYPTGISTADSFAIVRPGLQDGESMALKLIASERKRALALIVFLALPTLLAAFLIRRLRKRTTLSAAALMAFLDLLILLSPLLLAFSLAPPFATMIAYVILAFSMVVIWMLRIFAPYFQIGRRGTQV